MERRKFLYKAATVSAASAIIPVSAHASSRPEYEWRMVLGAPKTFPVWGAGIARFADHVEQMTSGRLKIRIYGAGELVPALETFSAVQGGEVEMGHSAAYYWLGKVPASIFFCAMPFGMTSSCFTAWMEHGEGQSLWDELMAPHGVKSLPLGNTGYQMSGWFNRAITTIDDLKGLKIRIAGLANRVYARAGAVPVLLPGSEVFTGLSTGVIDAVEWIGPYNDYVLGFHRAAKYYYAGSWHEPGPSLELMINKKAWDSLPSDLQLAIQVCAAEADRWMRSLWESKNAEYLQKMKDEKVDIREMPIDVLRKLKTFAREVREELIQESEMAFKIAASYSNFQKTFEQYQNLSERAYNKAFREDQ